VSASGATNDFAGFAMLAIFALAAGLMYARVLPALLAVPLMALAIAAVSGAGLAGMTVTIVHGTVRLADVIVTVVFGALLSRVTLATGIAETIVAYAAEFGGDRPAALALILCAAVALLFSSLTGLGAIIMVGSIVLPIMMTVGVPRKTAATLFLLAFALGYIFNIAQWTFYTATFGVDRATMQPYAYALAGLDLCALAAFAFVRFRSTRGYAAWALEAEEPLARKRAPLYALVTPALPIVLYFAFHVSALVAFALCALYGVLATRPKKAIETLVASAIRGAEDVAPAIWLFMGIGMLLDATSLPAVKAALLPIVAAIAPHSWFGYVALFGILSPLALYRGPLNPFGVGIVVYTVLAGLGVLPAVVLVAAVMAVVQVQNVCDPTNTANVWVGNFTGTSVEEIMQLTLPFQAAVAIAATLVVVLFGAPLLGAQPFALAPAASAAEPQAANTTEPQAANTTEPRAALVGLFANPASSDVIGVGAGSGSDAALAAAQVIDEFTRSWGGVRAMPYGGDVAASDCAEKPFAAYVLVTASAEEIGLELSDCAGWPVNQWYVPRGADVRASALDAAFRMRTWSLYHKALARTLLQRGLSYDPARTVPSYYYTLFKTNDGQMRAFVRPGGPAYVAGMRTNDIVEKIDGRFWWEYGTFQTQARAYDGKPHTFLVSRANVEKTIALGAPFAPAP
jgi:hypothetical protein